MRVLRDNTHFLFTPFRKYLQMRQYWLTQLVLLLIFDDMSINIVHSDN